MLYSVLGPLVSGFEFGFVLKGCETTTRLFDKAPSHPLPSFAPTIGGVLCGAVVGFSERPRFVIRVGAAGIASFAAWAAYSSSCDLFEKLKRRST